MENQITQSTKNNGEKEDKTSLDRFLMDVHDAIIKFQNPFLLCRWDSHEEYFDFLNTPTLETLNQQTRKHLPASKNRLEKISSFSSMIV